MSSARPRCGVELKDKTDYTLGLEQPPQPGDDYTVHTDTRCAERLVEQRGNATHELSLMVQRWQGAEARVAELERKLTATRWIGRDSHAWHLDRVAALEAALTAQRELTRAARERLSTAMKLGQEAIDLVSMHGYRSDAHRLRSALAALDATEEK